MAQTTYQKIEEYVDLAIEKGYSKDYILGQLETKKANFDYYEYSRSFYEHLHNHYLDLKIKVDNATGNLRVSDFLLVDFLKERLHPKPAYLSDLSIHPAVRRYFEALYNLIDDYELYFALPCNPDEFIAIEEHFGVELPKAFKDFYLITNGGCEAKNASVDMVSAFYWYSSVMLKDIIQISKEESEYFVQGNPYWSENGLEPKVHFNSLKPMAFASDNTGNFLYFDFNEHLESGMEIIEIGADIDRTFITKSFEELLNNISICMEKVENIAIYYKNNSSYPYHLVWQIDLYEVLNPALLEK